MLHARILSPVKPANPSTSPARGTHGLKRPVATWLVRKSPGRGRARPGFSRLLVPIPWSDLPGDPLGLASRNRCGRFGRRLFVGRPAHRTPSVTPVTWSRCFGPDDAPKVYGCARMIDSRQVCDGLPDGRMREANDNVLDRQGLRPRPSSLATASLDLAPCITRMWRAGRHQSRQGAVPCKVTGRLGP